MINSGDFGLSNCGILLIQIVLWGWLYILRRLVYHELYRDIRKHLLDLLPWRLRLQQHQLQLQRWCHLMSHNRAPSKKFSQTEQIVFIETWASQVWEEIRSLSLMTLPEDHDGIFPTALASSCLPHTCPSCRNTDEQLPQGKIDFCISTILQCSEFSGKLLGMKQPAQHSQPCAG